MQTYIHYEAATSCAMYVFLITVLYLNTIRHVNGMFSAIILLFKGLKTNNKLLQRLTHAYLHDDITMVQ